MKKNVIPVVSWVFITTVVLLAWYLRLHEVSAVLIGLAGSIIGFGLPFAIDIAETKLAGQIIAFRSYPLLAAYFLIGFLVLSSSHDFFPRGFIIGLGSSLLSDLFLSRTPIENLKARWFSVFRANLSDKEYDIFVYGSIGVYLALVVLSLFI